MAGIMKLKNVLREPNVVQLKPWKSIHNTIKEPMITGLGPLISRTLYLRWDLHVSPNRCARFTDPCAPI
jgi:hypothetical protein